MKMAASNIGWSKEEDTAVYQMLQSLGFMGLEIAPTRWFPDHPYDHTKEAVEQAKILREQYGLSICSMQSIWYGKSERIAESSEAKKHLLAYTEKALQFADALECGNLVFGNPRNRTVANNIEREIVTDFLGDLAHMAEKYHAVIALEANPPIYNTNYANTTAEALEIVKAIDSKSLKVNLDLGTIIENQEDTISLQDNMAWINHVHISEPNLRPIKKRPIHNTLQHLLKMGRYAKFVSLEMGRTDTLEELLKSISYMNEAFG